MLSFCGWNTVIDCLNMLIWRGKILGSISGLYTIMAKEGFFFRNQTITNSDMGGVLAGNCCWVRKNLRDIYDKKILLVHRYHIYREYYTSTEIILLIRAYIRSRWPEKPRLAIRGVWARHVGYVEFIFSSQSPLFFQY